jgi:hypothetical protein
MVGIKYIYFKVQYYPRCYEGTVILPGIDTKQKHDIQRDMLLVEMMYQQFGNVRVVPPSFGIQYGKIVPRVGGGKAKWLGEY